jgi:hypothetical protein
LRDFEQKVKQKHGHFGDVLVHDLEQVAEFLGGDVDKIGLSDFFRLVPDPVFALDVVILTHELQKLEGSPVSDDTLLIVDLFVDCRGLEYVFPEHKLLVNIVEIVVVNCGGRKDVIWIFFNVAVVDIFKDELTEFGDEYIDIFHDLVQVIAHHFIDNVLLGERVAAEHIRNTAQ